MEDGQKYEITADLSYADDCGNGHNTFSISGGIERISKNGRRVNYCGGCIHEEIAKHFPEFTKYIKWHLCSSDGPIFYLVNFLYWMKEDELDNARNTAIWPKATDDELINATPEILLARLPALMTEFKKAMEELGFTY